MNHRQELKSRNFPSAQEEAIALKEVERYEGPESSYQLAFTDTDFLLREELRPVRFQLELLKPELVQQEQGIDATIVIFGSARIVPRDVALQQLEEARKQAQRQSDGQAQVLIRNAERQLEMSRYYEEARRLAQLVTQCIDDKGHCRMTVVTGGGPGIMEAGNRGAYEVEGRSIGLNIVLPHEQLPNPYITPELCFQFHYFALRKMHFLMRSRALVAFPGGFGTMDELFEVLTLIQTGKCRPRPVLLFGRDYWSRIINFDALVEDGMISPQDVDLFTYVETADEAWQQIIAFYELDV